MATVPLRVLLVATRSPYPPRGGGSATLHALLKALPSAGVSVRAVALRAPGPATRGAPYPLRAVNAKPRTWLDALAGLASRTPLAVARFRLVALAAALEAEMATFAPDVVHLEQLHLAWLLPRLAGRVPVVLRQQNVESLLLERLGRVLPPPLRWAARYESRRTRRFERWACASATLVAAISEPDAAALRALAPQARVEVLPAAIAFERSQPLTLRGSPPFLCLGSFDWLPNRDGARWLVRDVWPELQRLVPGGVLHLAGPGSTSVRGPRSDSVERHGPVASAASLYDPAAVALIPLRAGSGVRMRLVEAWAAGVPAVVTAPAAEGLLTTDGDGALVALTPQGFAEAAARLAADIDLRARLTARGRSKLASHEGGPVASRARELYLQALAGTPRAERRHTG
jgi:glycosyltransferase involved in cell wall biosynthesis